MGVQLGRMNKTVACKWGSGFSEFGQLFCWDPHFFFPSSRCLSGVGDLGPDVHLLPTYSHRP